MWKQKSAALQAVRFAVRLKILAERHSAENGDVTTPLLQHSRPATPQCHLQNGKGPEGYLRQQASPGASQWALVSDVYAIMGLVQSSWVNLLLLCIPFAILSGWLGWSSTPTFCLNFVVLIPLALLLGDITEDLALRMGDIAGGLLNATFGNVTEVVLSIAALRKGLLDVVADTLLGSILSNLLLVLGTSFLVGGLFHHTQSFNKHSNRTMGSLLFLSCIGVAIPTCAKYMIDDPLAHEGWVLTTSRGVALVLLICYLCYLVFQLVTHKSLFDEACQVGSFGSPSTSNRPAHDMECGMPSTRLAAADSSSSEVEEEGQSCLQEEVPVLSPAGAVLGLAAISALVALHSEYLTRTIEETSTQTGISTGFLALIVLPIAGNACEHMTAVIVAAKNKMDLTMGIAIGSSLQIALFAIPLAVIAGWSVDQPMSLSYDSFEVVALVLAVVHANLVNADGTTHWLMGVQLCAVYILIALVYWWR